MSPDFDFWDRESDEIEEHDLKSTRSEEDTQQVESHFKDLMHRPWMESGTFVVRSEEDKLTITISSEDGVNATINVSNDVMKLLLKIMDGCMIKL